MEKLLMVKLLREGAGAHGLGKTASQEGFVPQTDQ